MYTKSIQNGMKNEILEENVPIHSWHQFILEYTPRLVEYCLPKLNINKQDVLLDPLCEIGKIQVEWIKDIRSNFGVKTNQIAFFASKLKTNTNLDMENPRNHLRSITNSTIFSFKSHDLRKNLKISEILTTKNQVTNDDTLSLKKNQIKVIKEGSVSGKTLMVIIFCFRFHNLRENLKVDEILTIKNWLTIKNIPLLKESQMKTISEGFTSQIFLMKVLVLRNIIQTIEDSTIQFFFSNSLANLTVKKAENISISPEIYRKKPKDNIEAICYYPSYTASIIQDLQKLSSCQGETTIILEDLLNTAQQSHKNLLYEINYVKTSSLYPNQKDCNRSIKLENVSFCYIKNSKCELKNMKEKTHQNNFRNIYSKDKDGDYIKYINKIEELADEIERKKIALEKASGLQKIDYRIVRRYFGVIYSHLTTLELYLVQSEELAFVLKNQTFFLRKYMQIADFISEIAQDLDYKVIDIDFVKDIFNRKKYAHS